MRLVDESYWVRPWSSCAARALLLTGAIAEGSDGMDVVWEKYRAFAAKLEYLFVDFGKITCQGAGPVATAFGRRFGHPDRERHPRWRQFQVSLVMGFWPLLGIDLQRCSGGGVKA